MAYKIKDILPLAKEYYFNEGLLSINFKMFQKHFQVVQSAVNSSGLTPEQFFEAATYKTLEEKIRNQIMYPRLLASEYVKNKVEIWHLIPEEDRQNIDFYLTAWTIERSKKRATSGYFEVDKPIPQFLQDIKSWDISLLYCVMDERFLGAIKKLDPDVYEEYLGEYDLKAIRNTIYLNSALYNTIKT